MRFFFFSQSCYSLRARFLMEKIVVIGWFKVLATRGGIKLDRECVHRSRAWSQSSHETRFEIRERSCEVQHFRRCNAHEIQTYGVLRTWIIMHSFGEQLRPIGPKKSFPNFFPSRENCLNDLKENIKFNRKLVWSCFYFIRILIL